MIVNGKKVIDHRQNLDVFKFPCEWAADFGLRIIDLNGQWTELTYNSEHVTVDEFLNKVSHCKMDKPKEMTRREAQALKQKIFLNKHKKV